MTTGKRVVIVGGGFAGVRAALSLSRRDIPHLKIVLISNKKNFEYHGALYRFATGGPASEVCFPIRDILDEKKVEFVTDTITSIDSSKKVLESVSGSVYKYDTLILALGSETNYFSVMGASEYSFGMRSIKDALHLKEQIKTSVLECKKAKGDRAVCAGRFIVVGAGATGVEIASEIKEYASSLVGPYKIDSSHILVDLVEASSRILPMFPEEFSEAVSKRLRLLGVRVLLNKTVLEEDIDGVTLNDMDLRAKTVIWTAGAQANSLYLSLKNADFDEKGRVYVDEYLKVKGEKDIFALGDGAVTEYSGMAQTAIADANYVARLLAHTENKKEIPFRKQKVPIYAIPVGKKWAATMIKGKMFYGQEGWFLRRVVDLIVFITFLPVHKVFHVLTSSQCKKCQK